MAILIRCRCIRDSLPLQPSASFGQILYHSRERDERWQLRQTISEFGPPLIRPQPTDGGRLECDARPMRWRKHESARTESTIASSTVPRTVLTPGATARVTPVVPPRFG